MTIAETADRAARELRDALEPWASPETRGLRFDEWRSALARQLAEDATGVEFAEARLMSVYPRSQMTADQVDRAVAYNRALTRAYQTLDLDYVGLLQWAERHADATVTVPA